MLGWSARGQYAPQAGLAGSTAISSTSSLFESWATGCVIQRGFLDIADPSLGFASYGDSSLALGAADGTIVSLGDSGIADLTFANPIINGPGPDFAIFENGFRNPADSALAYLELGFVEVSSDGVHYFRFPATSLTPTDNQVSNHDYINASLLDNLAGKYIGNYGTPFDLDQLIGISGLDVNHITHVRIVDAIGSVSGHSSRDNGGRIINDPYPTPFPSCGFDLDAVGVLHQAFESVNPLSRKPIATVYPNPATDHITIALETAAPQAVWVSLTSVTGMVIAPPALITGATTIAVASYPSGLYYLVFSDVSGNKWTEKFIKD